MDSVLYDRGILINLKISIRLELTLIHMLQDSTLRSGKEHKLTPYVNRALGSNQAVLPGDS